MVGVVKLVPVANEIPPVAFANQLMVPAEAVAPNVTVPVPQREAGVVEVMVGIVFTVMVTAVLVELHPAAVVVPT